MDRREMLCYNKNINAPHFCGNCLPLFSLTIKAQREKLSKRETPEGDFALCGGRPRLRALDGAAFCKRRAKTFGYFDSADDFISCLNIGDVALI